jgi:exodeoxyribonuclease V alpha subunit
MSQQITGTVSDITFHNEENGFTVFKLSEEGSGKKVACVGVLPSIEKGETILAKGEWQTHARFGQQFNVSAFELVRPTSIQGISMLLGSGLIPNIGPSRAEKILAKFGIKTLEVLDNEPQRLLEVEGIGRKRLQNIVEAWNRQKNIRDLALFLQQFDISLNLIYKIYKTYGEKAREILSANPYVMIDDIWGVGFIKADAIAQKFGYTQDSYKRIKAGLIHVLQEANSDGHVYLPLEETVEKSTVLLGVPRELVLFSLDHAVVEKKLIKEQECVYLPSFYNAEVQVAQLLKAQVDAPLANPVDDRHIDSWLSAYSQKTGWVGDETQIRAVKTGLTSKVMLLTGGPGTGKTTTLQVIVSFFREPQRRILLAAPTGRAAQRMGTIASLQAKTIHRLLEFRPGKEGFQFGRCSENPLDCDVLIVDECSMVDLQLMRNLLNALRPQTALILVGDSNQLPSVGAGNVLADLMKSNLIRHVQLSKIFRQAAQSRIVTAAHEILAGVVPLFSNGASENCFFIKRDDPQGCLETITGLVTKRLPESYGVDPIRDIQILAPMHRGALGTQELNRTLQQHLNPCKTHITRGTMQYAKGDKVMQVQNNYEKEVFNGDIGTIAEIHDGEGLQVAFEGRVVEYEPREMDELTLAYCISIHKSQGCEFNTVIIPLVTQHYIMLQRNLLYTALTRARKLCVIVGSSQALHRAIKNAEASQRFSRLRERLQGLAGK